MPPHSPLEVETAFGPARVVIEEPDRPPSFFLALTHGAGGGVDTPDLLAVRDAALKLGGTVARITQPYRVRGARAPGSAARQDAAWVEVITALRGGLLPRGGEAALPLMQGGRSNGARVACRTAAEVDAVAVIALAFPLRPPGRPGRSRAAELRIPGRKLLIVSGDRDPFGVPGRRAGARVVVLAGETHALSRRPAEVGRAVMAWLPRALGVPRPQRAARSPRPT
jgi:predicted alpha/beta-hydrolase family hydrolase